MTKKITVSMLDYSPIGDIAYTHTEPFLELRADGMDIHFSLTRATQVLSLSALDMTFACKVWIALSAAMETHKDAEEIADLFAEGDVTIEV
jgi:hypothetical protein